ncbi:MAG: hypothetical protein ACOH1Y_17930 [Propionicimonas sp.]
MTIAERIPIPERAPEHMFTRGVEILARTGWTQADWDDLLDQGTWGETSDQVFKTVRSWLRRPPVWFQAPVTPAQVREMTALYGAGVPSALNALADGASERFVAAVLGNRLNVRTPTSAWEQCQDAHLSEPEAVGWAHTNHLNQINHHLHFSQPQQPSIVETARWSIPLWVAWFGPTAYLWVLAGFTQAEAVAIRDAGTVVTDDQLRVMAALNGAALPAGI